MLYAALAAITSINVVWVMEHCKARTAQQSSRAHLVWLVSIHQGFFPPPKNPVLRSMQRQESDMPPHLPVQLERLSMRHQGLHPVLGLQNPWKKTPKHLQKNPSKTPNFLLHSYFFITSSPAQVQQNFPNTVSLQILVLVICVDSQGKENATCYFTVTAMPWSLSLDLSTKNQLFSWGPVWPAEIPGDLIRDHILYICISCSAPEWWPTDRISGMQRVSLDTEI